MHTRRILLHTLVGSAICGSLLTTPLLSPSAMATAKFDLRHRQIITQARALAEMAALHQKYPSSRTFHLREQINLQTNNLLGYMLDNFNGPVEPAEVALVVFAKRDTSLWSEDQLAHLADGLVPVCVMRELLVKHRLQFSTALCGNWTRFVERYGAVLLQV